MIRSCVFFSWMTVHFWSLAELTPVKLFYFAFFLSAVLPIKLRCLPNESLWLHCTWAVIWVIMHCKATALHFLLLESPLQYVLPLHFIHYRSFPGRTGSVWDKNTVVWLKVVGAVLPRGVLHDFGSSLFVCDNPIGKCHGDLNARNITMV